jgi:nucleoside-diphosphate-sugar epimerase
MRDVKVSFDKIERVLGYKARIGVEEGIREMVEAIGSGLLSDMEVVLKNTASGD